MRSGDGIRFLAVDSIDWVEGDGNYVRLHAGSAEHRVRGTLKGFAERLAGRGFVHIHQSYVVNLDRVRELQPWSHGEFVVVLANGKKLVSSRTYSGALKRLLELRGCRRRGRSPPRKSPTGATRYCPPGVHSGDSARSVPGRGPR